VDGERGGGPAGQMTVSAGVGVGVGSGFGKLVTFFAKVQKFVGPLKNRNSVGPSGVDALVIVTTTIFWFSRVRSLIGRRPTKMEKLPSKHQNLNVTLSECNFVHLLKDEVIAQGTLGRCFKLR
jgi:hypothetical protein